MPTYEEAKRCPICGEPGVLKGVQLPPADSVAQRQYGIPRGAKVETYHCVNERCRWNGTGWAVQVNPDGSIPDRTKALAKDKDFPALPGWLRESAEQQVRDLRAMAAEEEAAQLKRAEQQKERNV
jgi:hypothetical protein